MYRCQAVPLTVGESGNVEKIQRRKFGPVLVAGIVAPIAIAAPGSHPGLLVLATVAGSLVLSHVNDSGFWLIKEFFNMTVADTLKTWTVAETIVGVAGLGFTMLLSLVL